MPEPMRETPLSDTAGYQLLEELGSAIVVSGRDWLPLREDVDTTILRVLVARGLLALDYPPSGIVHANVTPRGFATLERFHDFPC